MTIRNAATCSLLFTCLAVLAACGSNKPKDGPPQSGATSSGTLPADAVPRPEPRAKYGNGPLYEVLGKRYTVMPSAAGYKERGVASWYGKKFHGNLTSNREIYNMYAMTAAHKSLPLPTYVRVRNLSNGRTIVVRVNDRGPFVDNRIIDLSYAAATKLDMVGPGTALVEVEAITFDAKAGVRAQAPAAASTVEPIAATSGEVYAQVGAFGSRDNADRRLTLLRNGGIGSAFIHEDNSASPALFRVRVGPIFNADQYDLLVVKLAKLDINDPIIVNE